MATNALVERLFSEIRSFVAGETPLENVRVATLAAVDGAESHDSEEFIDVFAVLYCLARYASGDWLLTDLVQHLRVLVERPYRPGVAGAATKLLSELGQSGV